MIYTGDCLEILPTLDAESVQCVVTSPPYWGLRDYGVSGQLGLEKTPEEYVAKLVEVFREVKRVLRKDGTLWLNLGDSYASGGTGGYSYKSTLSGFTNPTTKGRVMNEVGVSRPVPPGLKPKDLIGIPWRVAFALQADGWYLRQDIIWAKPNPMPESVTDRCTKSHEYIFLLSKQSKYFYDAEAVKEDTDPQYKKRYASPFNVGDKELSGCGRPGNASNTAGMKVYSGTRNRRSVWTITTKPFFGAHFAVFPPEIPEICIKAGTSEKGCCPECGSPWERVVELVGSYRDDPNFRPRESQSWTVGSGGLHCGHSGNMPTVKRNFHGWRPTCNHNLNPVPCTVLDPFSGAGTTGLVAEKLGRKYIGIELKPEYVEMAEKRIEAVRLPLLEAP